MFKLQNIFKSLTLLNFLTIVNSLNITEYCENKSDGLFCSSEIPTERISCSFGNTFSCLDDEMCQDHGVVNDIFEGGMAKCVPYIDYREIYEFCDIKINLYGNGVYCYNNSIDSDKKLHDNEARIRIHCPTGLILSYKDDNLKCNQLTKNYANCKISDKEQPNKTIIIMPFEIPWHSSSSRYKYKLIFIVMILYILSILQ